MDSAVAGKLQSRRRRKGSSKSWNEPARRHRQEDVAAGHGGREVSEGRVGLHGIGATP